MFALICGSKLQILRGKERTWNNCRSQGNKMVAWDRKEQQRRKSKTASDLEGNRKTRKQRDCRDKVRGQHRAERIRKVK